MLARRVPRRVVVLFEGVRNLLQGVLLVLLVLLGLVLVLLGGVCPLVGVFFGRVRCCLCEGPSGQLLAWLVIGDWDLGLMGDGRRPSCRWVLVLAFFRRHRLAVVVMG